MNPSRLFILRPVATALFMAAIVLAGLIGLTSLPLSALPQVDYPTIQVTTLYPGASAEVMSQTVTAPLEEQLGEMSGLDRMTAKSSAGASVITLQFALSEDLSTAEQEVQAAINAANALLPADLPQQPTYAKVNPADSPILTFAISSDTMPLTQVQNIVNTRLAQKVSQVSGVGQVTLSGGQKPAIRIQADTAKLSSLGLALSDIDSMIGQQNANGAKGSFDGPLRSYQINANDQLETVADYENLVVTYANGAAVRLKDVATVVNGAENSELGAHADDTPAIIMQVRRQPGANVIQTVNAINDMLPQLLDGLPAGLEVRTLSDRTTSIRASIEHTSIELVLAVIFVVLIIFFFLHSIRATIVAGIAVPISLIGAFAAMYLLGFSLNNLSLMALTIATGFVVDDAIVMIENIERHVEEGLRPFQAALTGAREIGFTIISLTISLIAVLIPLLFMADVVGRLFREFALTLAITILISAVVSLTLTPMLSARVLQSAEDKRESKISRKSREFFERLEAHYERWLRVVFDHRRATMLAMIATIVVTGLLYVVIPKGLFPVQSTGQLRIETVARSDISYDAMAELQGEMADLILADPSVESIASMVGVDGDTNTALNTGEITVNLTEDADAQDTVIARIRNDAASLDGLDLYIQPVQDLTIDSETGPTLYRLLVEGSDTEEVNEAAQTIAAALADVDKVAHPYTDAGTEGAAAYIDVNRDTASRIGIAASDVDDALYSAFGQRIVSTIFTETSQYRVILEARPGEVSDPAQLRRLNVETSSGSATPFDAFSAIRTTTAPLTVTHVAQFPAATVGFDAAPGVSLGTAVGAVEAKLATLDLPATVSVTFTGSAEAFKDSLSNQILLVLAALVCVYIVLGVLYESYIHPLTILSTLPAASVGAIFSLWVTGHDLDIIGIIGIVLLIGIVKKNAIMMIDFALQMEREGIDPEKSIFDAAVLRFRPIMMTTFAALMAAIPMMLGMGDGAELRRPLGIAIFGGLLVSQVLTIFTTPIIYLWFDDMAQRARRRWGHHFESGDARGPDAVPAE